jgi:ribose transport system permease protein
VTTASHFPQVRSIPTGGAVAAFVLLCIMFGIYAVHEPSALSLFGVGNLLNNTVVLALAASGLTLVVLCRELDLSGPGVIAITNVVVATTSTGSLGGAAGSLAAVLAIGAVVGSLNGFLVAYLGLQSLAVSLGSLIVCQGVALLILPAPGGEVTDAFVRAVSGNTWVVPAPVIIMAVVGGLWLLLKQSRIGIAIYAVGADEASARLSGLNIRATRLFAFIASGLCCGIAGFVLSAEIGSGDPRVSDSFLLFMYAAVAIGGTSLSGGRGGVIGTLAGACILSVLQKMLFALGVADFYTNVFNGIIMILAIFFGRLSALIAGARGQGEV